jgi:metal-sulfur cluster biosynthetic enzyme
MTNDAAAVTKDDVLEVLRNVIDPELQLNLVDLGLIYDVNVAEGGDVKVQMTLTSPGCPYGPELVAETKAMVMMIRGVKSVNVEVVWTPPWSIERITEAARLELGLDV